MGHHWWMHGAHAAAHSDSKWGALFLIVVGFFLAPVLIGIPMLVIGFHKLLK